MSMTEGASRELERYLALATEMVILAGFDGYWKRVNPCVEAVLGYTEAEALSRPFMEFVHPDDRERTEMEARRVSGGATAFSFVNRMVCKDGSYKWIEWTATPIPEESLMWGVGRDVTERRRTERQQAALRRIATLVTKDVDAADLFAAVAEEVGRVVDAPHVAVARYEPDGTATVCGTFPRVGALYETGSRVSLEGVSVLGRIHADGEPARIDDYTALEGEVAHRARDRGIRSGVGVPIVAAGRIWGSIVAWSPERLPEDFEARLAEFIELLAAAISNAEATEALSLLAAEQAGLRRVATLVARGAPPAEVFAAVSREVDSLLRLAPDRARVCVVRFDPGPEHVVVGVSRNLDAVPLGSRWPAVDLYAPTRVRRTGRSARVVEHDLAAGTGPEVEFLRANGYLSQVSSPIVVNGHLWGAISANSAEELPPDTEERLENFIELIATSVANSESRDALARLVNEQTALRHVATLVAEDATTTRLAATVLEEVVAVLGVPAAWLIRYEPERMMSILGSVNDPSFPVGTRWPLEGTSVSTTVFETGRSARIDDFTGLEGPIATRTRESGFLSSLGVPIVVDGTVWGAICVGTTDSKPLPTDTEDRLDRFTHLVATAISNADAREHLRGLADEQAALRRVATLVARGAPPGDVFDTVALEVSKLLDADTTVVGRYDADGAATAVGSWSASPDGVPVGTRSAIGGRNVLTLVAETEQPARLEGYEDASGEAADIARHHNWSSSIAAPMIVEGRLWGVTLVATQRSEPFPAGAEERLAAFTDLVATAIANAQSRAEVEQLAQEQAALRRVATLVAKEEAPGQVFARVAEETGRLLGSAECTLLRKESDGAATNVGSWGEKIAAVFPLGSRFVPSGDGLAATVLRTGASHRIDDYSAVADQVARGALDRGIGSSVGCPIKLRDATWGAVVVGRAEPFPPETEARLTQITDLVATAVANAEARQALERVAAEQATLRRIATLVAEGAKPEEVFAAVAEETAATFDAITGVMRFTDDPVGVVMVGASNEAEDLIGTRFDLDDVRATADVYRSGRSARSGRAHSTSPTESTVEGVRLGIVSQVSAPISVDGRLWGAITVNAREELPRDTEERLENFTDLVSTAIANADSKSELAASRRRIVAAADEARRRIERDLHDGIQQRLIALTIRARSMTRRPADELPEFAVELSEDLKDVADELREVSRGIHPTILTEAGLGPALRALARRSETPIEVEVRFDERLPDAIEAAAYYIASEALTNVAKHARANAARLTATRADGALTLEVRDDGIGGVDTRRGSGILGLADRVEALGGTLSITSPAGRGTTLSVRLPVGA